MTSMWMMYSQLKSSQISIQQKFKLLNENLDDNKVHSPTQACAASTFIDIYISNVNVDIIDEN